MKANRPQNYPITRSQSAGSHQHQDEIETETDVAEEISVSTPNSVETIQGETTNQVPELFTLDTEAEQTNNQEQPNNRKMAAGGGVRLKKFTGNESAIVWLNHFDAWKRFHQIPDDEALLAVTCHFEDGAATWLQTLSATQRSDLGRFTEAFKARYNPQSTNMSLLSIKQEQHETTEKYLERAEKMALGHDLAEVYKVQFTVNGLHKHLKGKVMAREPKTFQELRNALSLAKMELDCQDNPTTTSAFSDLCANLAAQLQQTLKTEISALTMEREQTNSQAFTKHMPRQEQRSRFHGPPRQQGPRQAHYPQQYQPPRGQQNHSRGPSQGPIQGSCPGCELGAVETTLPEPGDIFAVEPSFDVPVVNITVVAGKTAILPCSVDYLGEHKVVWTDQLSTLLTFDIQRIIDDDRIGVDRPYTKDWNLIIHDVRYSDRGKYICQINTKPVKTKSVELIVLVPPTILEETSSEDVICREGDTVTLTCNVTGVPTPTVHWYRRPIADALAHEKEMIKPVACFPHFGYHGSVQEPCIYTTKSEQEIGNSGEILIIHNVSRYCDGIYQCVAFNEIPPAVNRDMVVQVEFAPEIILQNKRIAQSVGKETILECIIVAFPQALSFWMYKGEEVKTSNKYRIEVYNDGNHQITLSLRIVDITPEDFGKYLCQASNKLGEDSEFMELYDLRPSRPTTTSTSPPLVFLPPTTRRYQVPHTPDRNVENERRPQAVGSSFGGGAYRMVTSGSSLCIVFIVTFWSYCS